MVDDGDGRSGRCWWWWSASAAQLAAGLVSYKRGCGDVLMPIKAFAVASLFVGAGATTVAGTLHAYGIREVNDLKEVGTGIRKGLGVPPREAA